MATANLACYETLDLEGEEGDLCLALASSFSLAYPSLLRHPEREGVYAMEMIAAGRVISPLPGVPAYIFDLPAGNMDYIIIDGDMVLDLSAYPPGDRPLISYLRENNETSAGANARIVARGGCFYVLATRNIYVGEEVVYDADLFAGAGT